MNTYRILHGDALAMLRTLPDNSVHCVVTSPPYWGLRDYGHDGQIGLEETPDAYVARLVDVFREVRRVLRDDGTVFLNLGDSYAGGGTIGRNDTTPEALRRRADKYGTGTGSGSLVGNSGNRPIVDGLKPKDLVGIPWRVAFALQADGWWLRQDIIWHKTAPMPESVTDRCTKAHEYVFLLTKSARYFYDAQAIAEPSTDEEYRTVGKIRPSLDSYYVADGDKGRTMSGLSMQPGGRATRNKRSVWTLGPEPYAEAHFATMPPTLAELCIRAGCPVDGTVLDPFAGSGTTLAVSLANGRNSIGVELNAEYIRLAEKRIGGTQPALIAV